MTIAEPERAELRACASLSTALTSIDEALLASVQVTVPVRSFEQVSAPAAIAREAPSAVASTAKVNSANRFCWCMLPAPLCSWTFILRASLGAYGHGPETNREHGDGQHRERVALCTVSTHGSTCRYQWQD